MNPDKDTVKVAVKIRPLIDSELSQGCKNILEVYDELKQIRVKDSSTAFTYNHVYDTSCCLEKFYDTSVKDLLDNLFKGYNVTILAYGQTGSGKTYSMGTCYNGGNEMGVIPRAISDIFNYVKDNFLYDFTITVSFMELYQEVLYDLLAEKPRDQCSLEIREDGKGILIPGLTEILVGSTTSTIELLSKGSSARATSSTNMNAQSSRSHAIFTINISMQKKNDPNSNKSAKFHLVDLAGSERSKKTGATGVVFREGININKGLLALGNVISALGDEKQQGGYICYRESNLTRLLKDSLGGNSITLMICCVSPADYNYQETISTLRYADRARKIKNKPVVNQDPKAAEINRLNKLIQQLRLELVGQGGSIICQVELEQIKRELEALKTKNRELTSQLSRTLTEKTNLFERIMLMQSANEAMSKKLQELKDEYNITVSVLSQTVDENNPGILKDHIQKLHDIENLFTDLNCQLTKNEDEIRRHERCGSLSNSINSDTNLENELCAEQESHMKKQFAINTELQEVTKILAMKEEIAQQMLANAPYLVNYNNIAENEHKIMQLQKEKDELLKQLKDSNVMGAHNKVSEQRRMKVIELEKQMHELQKKINEQSRMIKLKEKDEQKIRQLNGEIQEMKQTKIKLIRVMKQETDRFNTWRLQRERELSKLKDQDRKRQNQIIKMETRHNMQQNVLRRKFEEAAAINKRLKDSLSLHKKIQEQKNNGKVERMVPWIQQEIEIAINTIQAESTIANLLNDRTALTSQLDHMNNNNNKYSAEDFKQLEEDLEVRSVQIRDLQQKILDSDQENKNKTRFDQVQSMGDAKFLLKTLFGITIESQIKEQANQEKIRELSSAQEEMNRRLDCQENSIKTLNMQHQENLSQLNKEYEEKICLLLRQLHGITVDGVEEQMKRQCEIQQQRLEQLESENNEIREQNLKYTQEIDMLHIKRKEINGQLNNLPDRKAKIDANMLLPTKTHPGLSTPGGEDLNSTFDDRRNDPDWHKTPLAKRVRQFKIPQRSSDTSDNSGLGVKRSSDGSCACKRNCSRRTCGCRRFSRLCGASCKCSNSACQNRNGEKENLTQTIDESSTFSDNTQSEDLPKRSRILLEENSNSEVSDRRRAEV